MQPMQVAMQRQILLNCHFRSKNIRVLQDDTSVRRRFPSNPRRSLSRHQRADNNIRYSIALCDAQQGGVHQPLPGYNHRGT